ncbi:hypothetical protein GUJ93_ZPchr0004g39684 [Zizania palustris]|uniref:Uncharacterized protein n=1 Tax=Zizania palustris TaxID=103762 RepID=A0A8J5VZ10_ZIZPA|nr:hypothetical protein GUJ93_ZPchr0004g39684 [Zizania palustris]
MTRPVTPVIAAMFATECNNAVRNHIPVHKHWSEYKKKPVLFDLFLARIRAQFDVNTDDTIVKKACMEMMKIVVRQQRYRLKERYFDPFALHLVMKTSPLKCMSNE